jgi:hypothetical protein
MSALKTRIVLGQTEMHFTEFNRKKFLTQATDSYEEARDVLQKQRRGEYHKYFSFPIAEALVSLHKHRGVRPFTMFEEPSNAKILQGSFFQDLTKQEYLVMISTISFKR